MAIVVSAYKTNILEAQKGNKKKENGRSQGSVSCRQASSFRVLKRTFLGCVELTGDSVGWDGLRPAPHPGLQLTRHTSTTFPRGLPKDWGVHLIRYRTDLEGFRTRTYRVCNKSDPEYQARKTHLDSRNNLGTLSAFRSPRQPIQACPTPGSAELASEKPLAAKIN